MERSLTWTGIDREHHAVGRARARSPFALIEKHRQFARLCIEPLHRIFADPDPYWQERAKAPWTRVSSLTHSSSVSALTGPHMIKAINMEVAASALISIASTARFRRKCAKLAVLDAAYVSNLERLQLRRYRFGIFARLASVLLRTWIEALPATSSADETRCGMGLEHCSIKPIGLIGGNNLNPGNATIVGRRHRAQASRGR